MISSQRPRICIRHTKCSSFSEKTGLSLWDWQFEGTNAGVRHLGPPKIRCPLNTTPDYERVASVKYNLVGARLHDKGMVLLPVWVIEYLCLGHSFRAFVSAICSTERPTISAMWHGGEASGLDAATADATMTWRAVGEMRERELQENLEWQVSSYWMAELSRVSSEAQSNDFSLDSSNL